jgi:CheY-like chemotaxis protein
MGMLELITEDRLTQRQEEYVRACRTTVDRLLRTVHDVSELARPDASDLTESGFDVEEVVGNVSGIMGALASRKGLQFECGVKKPAPVVLWGDRERIEDMLVRLLDNAIRFTNHGAIGLRTSIEIVEQKAARVEFLISDTGPGVPEDTLWQDTQEGRIAGLGLPLVRRTVERMGGEMAITAEPGIGSLVRIALRLRIGAGGGEAVLPPPAAGADDRLASIGTVGPPLNLLVAEDSDDSFILFEAYLAGQGHQIARAYDGAHAIELFKVRSYDLVFMDIRMPVLDGFSATRAIREWETTAGRRRTPILVLSAEDFSVQKRIGATVGCSGYLMKPVSKAALLGALARYSPLSIR